MDGSSRNSKRRVQQTGRDFTAHALAQRQLAHRRLEERAEIEDRRQGLRPSAVRPGLDLVHPAEEREGVPRRQLIPELRPLPEDRPDAERQRAALARGHETEHPGVSRVGMEHARQHLQRRRLAGAVGSDEGDALAGLDGERQPVDRHDRVCTRDEEILNARRQAAGPRTPHAKRFRELVELDGRCGRHGDTPGAALRRIQKSETPFRKLRKGVIDR